MNGQVERWKLIKWMGKLWVDGWVDGWVDECVDGCVNERIGRQMMGG